MPIKYINIKFSIQKKYYNYVLASSKLMPYSQVFTHTVSRMFLHEYKII